MEMHWATVWESIADVVGDRPAVTNGTVTRSWAEYEDRAARVAAAHGCCITADECGVQLPGAVHGDGRRAAAGDAG